MAKVEFVWRYAEGKSITIYDDGRIEGPGKAQTDMKRGNYPYKILRHLFEHTKDYVYMETFYNEVWGNAGRDMGNFKKDVFGKANSRLKDSLREILPPEDDVNSLFEITSDGNGYKLAGEVKVGNVSSVEMDVYSYLVEKYYHMYKNMYLDKFKLGNRNFDEEIPLSVAYECPTLEFFGAKDKPWGLDKGAGKYLVQAPNGFGKTSLMKSILLSVICEKLQELSEGEKARYAELRSFHHIEKEYFPIMLEAKRIPFKSFERLMAPCTEEELLSFLYNTIGLPETVCTQDEFAKLLKDYNKNRQVLLLIDGYDEVEEEYRLNCREFIERVTSSSYGSNATVVVTSRPMSSAGTKLGGGFSTYRIAPILIRENQEALKAVVERYSRCAPNRKEIDADAICSRICNNEFLRELLINPFTISMAVSDIVFRKEASDLMHTNVIAWDLIESLALRFVNLQRRNTIKPFLEIFEELAYEMLCHPTPDGLGMVGKDIHVELRSFMNPLIRVVRGRNEVNLEGLGIEELWEMMFTNMGLLERVQGRIAFVAPQVLTPEFGARKLVRAWARETDVEQAGEQLFAGLEAIEDSFRYCVVVMMITILSNMDGLEGILPYVDEPQDVVTELAEYLLREAASGDCIKEEYSQKAIVHILDQSYGENVIVKRSKDMFKDCSERMQKIVRR